MADPDGSVQEHPLLDVVELTTELATARGSLRAVDGLSMHIDAGECVGVVGESGSGKSMLMRSIMGIQPAFAELTGFVIFDGTDLRTLKSRRLREIWGPEIAMVFQDPMTSLNPVRKIVQQMTDPIRGHLALSRSQATNKAEELMRQVGIPEPKRRLGQYPHQLSGGMRQRVGIALALSCEPRLLIADEPTTALDVTVQKQILDLLASLRRERQMAMLLVTHDMSVVAGRTDRVLVMYAGRVVESARTTELFDHPGHPYTRALLDAIPRLDVPSHQPMEAIPGSPPDMVEPPPGCRFAPRCPRAQAVCTEVAPPLVTVGTATHSVECHFPIEAVVAAPALSETR